MCIYQGFTTQSTKDSSSIIAGLQSTAVVQSQNPAYPLYPSVVQLLHEKKVPDSEIPKIPASGPKGRLLKGDVLAYLGAIASDYPSGQAQRLQELSHLDLSNIKIAPPPVPSPVKPDEKTQEKAAVSAPTPMASVAISISLGAVLSVQKKLEDSLGISVPLSTFLARATDLANDELPRSSRDKPSGDELFDELLGAEPVKTSRGDYVPELNKKEVSVSKNNESTGQDIIDILSGKTATLSKSYRKPRPVNPPKDISAMNVFSLTVPPGDKNRARTFLERVKDLLQVEPGRLVL